MANASVSLQGAVNNAGANDALFYKLFTGEVLAAFDEKNVMMSRHRVRSITEGKSASFANTGKAYGSVHTPGSEIVGKPMNHNETVITVDDLMISDVFIANIFEAKNHYDVRRDYSKQCGEALARTTDKQIFRIAATAAAASNKITGLPGGTTITLSLAYNTATDADKAIEFADALFDAHQKFVENDVDSSSAFAVIRPADFFRLVRNKDLLNQDWGGLGSYARAELPMVGGIPLVVSNHVPAQNDSLNGHADTVNVNDGGDIVTAKYAGDYSKLQAVIMTPEACGTVKLIELGLESEYDIRRQGTLIVAKQAQGSGVLRPECAQAIYIT